MARKARNIGSILRRQQFQRRANQFKIISKQSRFLAFASGCALLSLGAAALWSQNRRVVRVELVQTRSQVNGKSQRRKWVWRDSQAQKLFDQIAFDPKNSGNMCLNIDQSNVLAVTTTRKYGASATQELNLNGGQITPYQNGSLPQLKPGSLRYFQTLVAQTPPNAQ